MEAPQYTRAVGQKFNKDGSVRRFPGNTVISKITPATPIYVAIVEAQQRLKAANWAGKYAFLPPSSFHMTVIEGLCDHVRRPELWSKELDLEMPFDEVNQFMLERFARLSPLTRIEMRILPIKTSRLLVVGLEPADPECARSLQHFRDEFSLGTGIRFPDHDTYRYHITLAYNLIELTADEEPAVVSAQEDVQSGLASGYPSIALKEPRLTFFENMFHFDDAF